MTDTHAARRRRTAVLRNLGKGLILLAVLAVLAGIVLLFIEVDLVGASSTGFTTCGGFINPVPHPSGLAQQLCGAQLNSQALAAFVCGLLGVAAGVVGGVVLRRNPARLGF
jgi:hypothetical protein